MATSTSRCQHFDRAIRDRGIARAVQGGARVERLAMSLIFFKLKCVATHMGDYYD